MNHYKYFVIILYVINVFDTRANGQASVISNVHHLQRKREPLRIKSGQRRFPAPKTSGDVFELFFGVLLPEEAIDIGCTYKEALPAIELAIKKLQMVKSATDTLSRSILIVYFFSNLSNWIQTARRTFRTIQYMRWISRHKVDVNTWHHCCFWSLHQTTTRLIPFYFKKLWFLNRSQTMKCEILRNRFIPDVIFGPIESYSLAQIIRFAGVWETPVIAPGGIAEAFTMKEHMVNIWHFC